MQDILRENLCLLGSASREMQ